MEQAKAAPAAAKAVAPPPPPADLAAAAPPPAVLPSFSFSDGAREGLTSDDPVVLYKYQLETALRSKWERPTDVEDITYVAEAEMAVASSGQLLGYEWKKGSGDKSWDDSVRKALAGVKAISRAPPKGFPEKVIVRFDVLPATAPLVSRAD